MFEKSGLRSSKGPKKLRKTKEKQREKQREIKGNQGKQKENKGTQSKTKEKQAKWPSEQPGAEFDKKHKICKTKVTETVMNFGGLKI